MQLGPRYQGRLILRCIGYGRGAEWWIARRFRRISDISDQISGNRNPLVHVSCPLVRLTTLSHKLRGLNGISHKLELNRYQAQQNVVILRPRAFCGVEGSQLYSLHLVSVEILRAANGAALRMTWCSFRLSN